MPHLKNMHCSCREPDLVSNTQAALSSCNSSVRKYDTFLAPWGTAHVQQSTHRYILLGVCCSWVLLRNKMAQRERLAWLWFIFLNKTKHYGIFFLFCICFPVVSLCFVTWDCNPQSCLSACQKLVISCADFQLQTKPGEVEQRERLSACLLLGHTDLVRIITALQAYRFKMFLKYNVSYIGRI
jgi:hypothetical protein